MPIPIEVVHQLRQQTGLGLKQVVDALNANGGDLERAKQWLRANAKAKLEDPVDPAAEGRVAVYLHHNSAVGAMILLSCKTDFTARNEEFIKLANDIAMHVAAAKPRWINTQSIDPVTHAAELSAVQERTAAEGIPEARRQRVVEGRMRAFYAETVLYEQPFVRDQATTVGQLIAAMSAKTGEPIAVKQMARFQVGQAQG